MLHPRKILLLLGALLVIGGGWWAWRASQPALSDEEQIAANLEDIQRAVQSRNAGRVTRHLAEDFSWNGLSKRELESQIRFGFVQWRDVQPNLTGVDISVNGNQATATGNYSLAFRPRPKARRPEAYIGEFRLQLEKREGEWLITRAEGGDKLPD